MLQLRCLHPTTPQDNIKYDPKFNFLKSKKLKNKLQTLRNYQIGMSHWQIYGCPDVQTTSAFMDKINNNFIIIYIEKITNKIIKQIKHNMKAI